MVEYQRQKVAVDIVVFSVIDKDLKVLLIKRKIDPFRGKWALPGGFVLEDENLEEAARRELLEETGVSEKYLEQLYTFGNPKRDPRGRVITVAYYALVDSEKIKLKADSDAEDAQWFSKFNLPKLAFDHKEILHYAAQRLRWKFEYTLIAFSLLPKRFTMSELQELYEIVFVKKFDKRNFRKKVLSLGILQEEEVKREVSHRPPQLYSLKKEVPEIIEII